VILSKSSTVAVTPTAAAAALSRESSRKPASTAAIAA
jgi:hypothetical protein